MSGAHYPDSAGSADRSNRFLTEALVALSVAALVAAIVVVFGSAGNAGNGGRAGGTPSASATPSVSPSPSESATESESPTDGPTQTEDPIEVTKIDMRLSPGEYVGKCPAKVTVSADIYTNTGPVTVHYRWLDVDGAGSEEKTVRFGGPGPQKATVSDQLTLDDDQAVYRRLQVTAPNELTSEPVEGTVTCTPTARTALDLREICASEYEIVYHGSITVPHGPMTVTYTWERSDGATGPVLTVEFPAGGRQTKTVPDSTWHLWTTGEFSQRIKILTPFEATSNWSRFTIC